MTAVDIFLASPLEKVFPDKKPEASSIPTRFLQGEKISFQLVYFLNSKEFWTKLPIEVSIEGDLPFELSEVQLMPSELPVWPDYDKGYLKTTPGLFPDLLKPIRKYSMAVYQQYRSLFVTLSTENIEPGEKEVTVIVKSADSKETVLFEEKLSFEVLGTKLDKPRLYHTEWFHVDSLISYYGLTPYDEKCWDYLDNFVQFAAKRSGINTLLTPIFTPPLDTAEGKERLNVQLLEITHEEKMFTFGFDKLRRWCQMCKRAGITHLEMPHLFTQWGAKKTPNIYLKDGTKIFGWHIPATSALYRQFLVALIPQLMTVLREEGYDQSHVIFHLSDEPNEAHLESYQKAHQQVADLLENYKVVDALSEYQFYEKGLVRYPVVANDALEPFLEKKVSGLWTYYCCAQTLDVPNRFFALPSYRNRVMGVLLYVYQIEGFLQWGFNFYHSQLSKEPINPFQVTDAKLAFPSGDPFLVYPGEKGQVLSSLRNEVQMLGLTDLALLQQAEKIVGRDKVVALIEKAAGEKLSFKNYPQNGEWFNQLHEELLALF